MKLRLSLLLATLVAVAIMLIAFSGVSAHGIGQPQVVSVSTGPYLISVWSDPDPLREDETHLVVAVMDPITRAPLVENVSVSIRMDPSSPEAAAVTAHALSDNSTNQLLYVVEFNDLITEGQWQATVIIDGPSGTASDVSFPLEITAARGFNWLWLGLAGLVVLLIGWLILSLRKTPAASGTRLGRRDPYVETPS